MPNLKWDKLTTLQLGRYGEYYAKMEFASYGFEVYTSEVDDHGVDFVVKGNQGGFKEIQVKSIRAEKTNYIFIQKTKFDISNRDLYLALLVFHEGKLPDVFLIPSEAWEKPNEVFVDRNYDKEGQTSKPEYGINISQKNYWALECFKIEDVIGSL